MKNQPFLMKDLMQDILDTVDEKLGGELIDAIPAKVKDESGELTVLFDNARGVLVYIENWRDDQGQDHTEKIEVDMPEQLRMFLNLAKELRDTVLCLPVPNRDFQIENKQQGV